MNPYVVFPLFISGGLIVQHRYSHRNDAKLTEFEKWFQFSDITNHETWVIFFLGVSVTAYIAQRK